MSRHYLYSLQNYLFSSNSLQNSTQTTRIASFLQNARWYPSLNVHLVPSVTPYIEIIGALCTAKVPFLSVLVDLMHIWITVTNINLSPICISKVRLSDKGWWVTVMAMTHSVYVFCLKGNKKSLWLCPLASVIIKFRKTLFVCEPFYYRNFHKGKGY